MLLGGVACLPARNRYPQCLAQRDKIVWAVTLQYEQHVDVFAPGQQNFERSALTAHPTPRRAPCALPCRAALQEAMPGLAGG